MSVRQVGIGTWFSTLTGQSYDSELAARTFDLREAKKVHPETEGSKLLDSLSASQIKSLYQAAAVEADIDNAVSDWREVQEQFLEAMPAFHPCTENGVALQTLLLSRGKLDNRGTFYGNLDDVIEAAHDLHEKGVLILKKGAKMPPRTNEVEMYAMSADELAKRSRGF